jgi:hypothetical protein
VVRIRYPCNFNFIIGQKSISKVNDLGHTDINGYLPVNSPDFEYDPFDLVDWLPSKSLVSSELSSLLYGNDGEILVFPNPSSGWVTVEIRSESQSENNIEILDLSGKVVYKSAFRENKTTIQTAEFRKGIYYIKITSNGRTYGYKLIFN